MKLKIRDLDDRELAFMLEEHYGCDNLLKGPSGVWCFDGRLWRRLYDDELKAVATNVLAERVDKVMRHRVTSMVEIFKVHNWMADLTFELGDPNLLVLADGYWAYQDGTWRKVKVDKELRRRVGFEWRYTDDRPTQFDRFLREILCDADGHPLDDRDQLTKLIWEMLGYCLAAHTLYERCFILCGPGANGKSVLGAVAKEMVGRAYTASVQPSQMGSVFQRSNLEGKLLNLVTELNQNEELEDGMLKAVISGEMMSVEKKHEAPREIEPFAKHIILTNHMPRIRDYSDGIFRRVSIINLQRQFLGGDADPHLLKKFKGEMDAIMSRAMDALGTLIERDGRFTDAPSCEEAKKSWRADNNNVEQFLQDSVYPNPDGRVAVQPLYDAYTGWFATTGLRGQLGRQQFARRVEAAGLQKLRMSEGYCFVGISLR